MQNETCTKMKFYTLVLVNYKTNVGILMKIEIISKFIPTINFYDFLVQVQ